MRALVALATVAALVVSGSVAAHADTGVGKADAVADLVADAAPVEADTVAPVEGPSGDLAVSGGMADVVVPSDADGVVAVTAQSRSGAAVQIDIGLPDEVSAGNAVVAHDGTVVYAGEAETDIAVQATGDGVRVQTILRNPNAPAEFTYTFDGAVPELNTDGSVALTIPGENGSTLLVGEIAAPWAVDANGEPVPTRYRVEGTELVQEVDHHRDAFAYPIVADPSYSIGRYIYIRYSRAEVKRIAPYAWTNRFQALFCLAIPNIVGAGACAIAVDQWASSIASAVVNAANRNRCFEMRYTLIGGAPVGWNSYAC